MSKYTNPLHQAAEMFPMTQLWNDSCGVGDIEFALARGGCGATSNPVIVGNVLRKEIGLWEERLNKIISEEYPSATDEEICWIISREAGLKGAQLLRPLFEETKGQKGWQALQVNPRFYRDRARTVAHAAQLAGDEPNVLIKMPVSTAGVEALEECVYKGVSVNGTVCFGIPQAVAVAEAIERGLKRREAENLPIDGLSVSCTIMTGRVGDYMRSLAEKRGVEIDPVWADMGGVAIFKKAYRIFRERGYRAKLLAANNNSHYLWSHLLGGDIYMTVNPVWWRELEGREMELRATIDEPVDEIIVDTLLDKFPEYGMIYREDGLMVREFNDYGAFKNTMSEFLTGYDAFIAYLRGFIMPR